MKNHTAIGKAILAAALFGISAPFSKILLTQIPATFMAAFLYLGAGLGMALLIIRRRVCKEQIKEAPLEKRDWPYVLGMILLDIAAPIFLMTGLLYENPATVSLLNNFEIVTTATIALLVFHEAVGKRMWIAIGLITLSSMLLSAEDISRLSISTGSVFVLLACICWGLENNCTKSLSLKDPLQIVMVKGMGSGVGALGIAMVVNGSVRNAGSAAYVVAALLLGFVAYGLSIYFYVCAQRSLGAARTSAYYAVAPFIGAGLSLILFSESVQPSFWLALALMMGGSYLMMEEKHTHCHIHQPMEHTHRHNHHDGHHLHVHVGGDVEHSHTHAHGELKHSHEHQPDMHHLHVHNS